jgi:hypothetical protein
MVNHRDFGTITQKDYLDFYHTVKDDWYAKKFLGMVTNILDIMVALGWDECMRVYDKVVNLTLDELIFRMEEAIDVIQGIKNGNISPEEARRMTTFWIMPPVLISRADLLQGSNRLVYGNSCDITFMGLSDFNKEVLFAINFHFEDGLPTNYWYVRPKDPLLDKRHMKLGIMFKDIPKNFPTLAEAGDNIIPILKDIRNEKDPTHAGSSYNICFFMETSGINNGVSMTNYDEYSFMWEGINCGNQSHWNKSANGSKSWFNDAIQLYEPWPPIFLQLTRLPRDMWIKRISGLLTDSRVYIQYLLADWDAVVPVKAWQKRMWDEGIALPDAVFQRRMPDCSSKNEKDWTFRYTYPKDTPRMTLDNLGLSLDDVRKGVLLDWTWQSKGVPSGKHVVAIGHGRNIKYEKEVKA